MTNGTWTGPVVLHYPGTDTLTASAGSLQGSSLVTVVPAKPVSFTFTTPAGFAYETAGVGFTVTVSALDAAKLVPVGYSGYFTLAVTGNSQSLLGLPTGPLTLTNGTWTGTIKLDKSGELTLTATSTTGRATGTSYTIDVEAGNPVHLSATAPGPATAGKAFVLTINATDIHNNPADIAAFVPTIVCSGGQTVYWSLNSARVEQGVYTVPITLYTAAATPTSAPFTLTVSLDNLTATCPIKVNAGQFHGFKVTTVPNQVYTGVAFTVTITAQDTWHNTIFTYSNPVTLSATGGFPARRGEPQPASSPITTWSNGIATSGTLYLENTGSVTITATANASATGQCTLNVASGIASLSTTVGYAPGYSSQYQSVGSSVTIYGYPHEFVPGDRALFGNPNTTDPVSLCVLADKWVSDTVMEGIQDIMQVGVVGSVNASGTALTVTVPRSAISGPVVVVNPKLGTSAQSTQAFTVNDFRNTYGFNFENGQDNTDFNITWGEFKSEYGAQADLSITVFGHTFDSGIPNPLALVVWGIEAAALNGNGCCYGMDLAIQQMMASPNMINAANGLPAGAAPTIYNLQPNGPLIAMIQNDLIGEFDAQVLHVMTGWDLGNIVGTGGSAASRIYNDIAGDLAKGECPIIGMPSISHAVLAYGLEPGPAGDGDYYIDTYNPNKPFNDTGEPETTQEGHIQALQDSRIYVNPLINGGSWQYTHDGWKTGGFDSLIVMPPSETMQAPTMPLSLTGIATYVFGSSQGTQDNSAVQPAALLPAGLSACQAANQPVVVSACQAANQPVLDGSDTVAANAAARPTDPVDAVFADLDGWAAWLPGTNRL